MPQSKRQKKSWTDFFFEEQDIDSGKFHCKFNACSGKTFSSTIGTGNLCKHIESKHPATHRTVKALLEQDKCMDQAAADQLMKDEVRGQVTLSSAFAKANVSRTERALALLSWLVIDCLPFSTADSQRFQNFCALVGKYKPPSTRQLLRYLCLLRKAVESIIGERLLHLEFVSVAVDEWSSMTLDPFLSIHFQGYTDEMELVHCEDLCVLSITSRC
jgi:hypothetical protein